MIVHKDRRKYLPKKRTDFEMCYKHFDGQFAVMVKASEWRPWVLVSF